MSGVHAMLMVSEAMFVSQFAMANVCVGRGAYGRERCYKRETQLVIDHAKHRSL